MRKRAWPLAIVLLLAMHTRAAATDLSAVITGSDGKPLPNAVVSIVPDSNSRTERSSSRPADQTVDQRNETFVPLVTIVPKGGRVTFANNDPTTHQVFSFSRIKQFELTLARGESSSIAFDSAGVAALGCNIHDRMIAYVFVAESPYTALTGDDGLAVVKNIPPGKYRAQVWHPQQRPGSETPSVELALTGEAMTWEASLKVLPPRKTRSHGGNY
jgi:plastocyanin